MKLFCSKCKDLFESQPTTRKIRCRNFDKNIIYKFDHYSNSDDESIVETRMRQQQLRFKNKTGFNLRKGGKPRQMYQRRRFDYSLAGQIAEHLGRLSEQQN